jgi:ribonuclease BN (tRNA processing enzyme)
MRLFTDGGGFGPPPALRATDVALPAGAGVHPVMEDDRVRVEASRVFHGPEVAHAYAYRFTVKATGTVVVFSGDTAAPDANLIDLAQGCDVLVHEVQDNDDVARLAASFPDADRARALEKHLLEAHSDVRDVPRVAHAAGAGRVVLSHYTPLPKPPAVYLAKAQQAADDIGYGGRVIAPGDLDVVEL